MRKKLSVIISLGIMVVMLAACGSNNISPVVDVPNGNEQEENAITEQIENSNSDSSVDSTSTPEAEPTEKPSATLTPTETITPEPTEEPASTPTPEPSEESTEEPTATPEPTETPEATPTETPVEEDEKKEPSSGSTENPSVTPTPSPTPSVTPTPTTKPSGDSSWSGGYDTLPSDGFDHIKVPTKSDFYDEGFDNPLGAFDFDDSDWSNEWWDAYQDFLVANGSPIDSDGNPMGAFSAIHDGFVNGYQYLYYGVNWSGSRDGWGDIVLLPRGLNSTMANNPNYDDAYVLELSNFTYGNMDKGVENEYRSATTMMLSWIVPNPQQRRVYR